jgi:tetraacyldisaccharide 4'-kinase
MNVVRIILFPIAILYGIITGVRNKFFDWGLLPTQSFNHPLIGVGNLSIGGTGKTPHIEYLIRLLKKQYKVATLSRGYKRKTKGFRLAHRNSTVEEIGDEPLQMFSKNLDIAVAVCEKRIKGVRSLLEQKPNNQVILLDDVFQHRYIKPGLNILLTDYHKLFTRNYILPTGTLRESRTNAKRADILVITKTPQVFSPLDRKLIMGELHKYRIKEIFFSYLKYGSWVPISQLAKREKQQNAKSIFLVTGIANPAPLTEHLKRQCSELKVYRYADHYQFKSKDLTNIIKDFSNTFSCTKAIVTTEKDFMRLRDPELLKRIQNLPVYFVPIEVEFHDSDKMLFDALVTDYVKDAISK